MAASPQMSPALQDDAMDLLAAAALVVGDGEAGKKVAGLAAKDPVTAKVLAAVADLVRELNGSA